MEKANKELLKIEAQAKADAEKAKEERLKIEAQAKAEKEILLLKIKLAETPVKTRPVEMVEGGNGL